METELIFKFDDEILEDRMKMKRVIKSDDMASSLEEIVRGAFKDAEMESEDKDLTGDEMLDLLKDRVNNILDSHYINLDEIIE